MSTDLELLVDEPVGHVSATVVLAHGAGAPMDSPFMSTMAQLLTARGFRVVRFEFPYMRRRRVEGVRQPPNRQPMLLDHWREVYRVAAQRFAEPTLIGGKSMGGRMAALVANELCCSGLVCLGFPAHPAGKPGMLRTEVLKSIVVPTLIVQGERDPLGRRDELESQDGKNAWSSELTWLWSVDGDHDLKPRKASGLTHEDNLVAAADGVAQWWHKIRSGTSTAGAAGLEVS